jgi:adenylate kinase
MEERETPLQALTREVFEETKIQIHSPTLVGTRHVRVPNCPDYTLHIFRLTLASMPDIHLSDEHVLAKWVFYHEFETFDLVNEAQRLSFRTVFGDAMWHLTHDLGTSGLKFTRGDKTVTFGPQRRLVVTLVGTTGSGKGTQGEFLAKYLGVPHISFGDVFRDEIRNQTVLGKMIVDHDQKHTDSFTPDEICLGMACKRLSNDDCRNGYILDGFPRSAAQADALLKVFLRPKDTHIPVYINLSEQVIRIRLATRFICPGCGHQVRAHDEIPRKGYCPQPKCTDIQLERRVEDADSGKLTKKFTIFSSQRDGILAKISAVQMVHTINLDGTESPSRVFGMISRIINNQLEEVK